MDPLDAAIIDLPAVTITPVRRPPSSPAYANNIRTAKAITDSFALDLNMLHVDIGLLPLSHRPRRFEITLPDRIEAFSEFGI